MRAFNACENAVAATMVKGPNPAANQTGADVVYAVNACQRKLGVDLVDLYISDSEYWTLQDREGALFLGAGALLWFAGWWWVRRARVRSTPRTRVGSYADWSSPAASTAPSSSCSC